MAVATFRRRNILVMSRHGRLIRGANDEARGDCAMLRTSTKEINNIGAEKSIRASGEKVARKDMMMMSLIIWWCIFRALPFVRLAFASNLNGWMGN